MCPIKNIMLFLTKIMECRKQFKPSEKVVHHLLRVSNRCKNCDRCCGSNHSTDEHCSSSIRLKQV